MLASVSIGVVGRGEAQGEISRCLYHEIVWIEGQVSMLFQIGMVDMSGNCMM